VVAAHGEVESLRERIRTTLDFAYSSPVNFEKVAVLLRARYFAAAATDALRHVEVESVLLAWPRPNRGFALRCPIQQE
jgi:hypothetical protein